MSSIGEATDQTSGHDGQRADVELRLPADSAYVSVLRTTTAGLAARLDFPIDDIEDLRIAVGEACAMVLPRAADDADLSCQFYLDPGMLRVDVGVAALDAHEPDYDSFAWQVLTTLATSASSSTADGRFTISLTMQSSVQESGPGSGAADG
jgi:serine/threonine-protein kinase RsbW